METDAVIIGGGACGLMCAVQAGFLGKRVVILEKNDRPGAKILISGGGRCNFTNLHTSVLNFVSENPDFVRSALAQWTVDDTISFFETYGIVGKEKILGQLFPETNKAVDVVNVFLGLCRDLGQELRCDTEADLVERSAKEFVVTCRQGGRVFKITAPKVVFASGGLPIRKLGATDFALRSARRFGLDVVSTAPALVPLTVTGKDAAWYNQLSGNSVPCRVWNKRISFEENVLFTHWGLSGPAILQLSTYWRAGEQFFIDFLPGKNVTELVRQQKVGGGKKQLSSLLSQLFTRKFADALGKFLPVGKNIGDLSGAEIEQLHHWIHEFRVVPAGDKGYEKAEVMRGGISTAELSSKTLECRKVPGLFFGGECVDVTGWLGGYNFQWAWASGFVIAQNL